VAVASFPKSNTNSSCSLTWENPPIASSLLFSSDVPPLLNSEKIIVILPEMV